MENGGDFTPSTAGFRVISAIDKTPKKETIIIFAWFAEPYSYQGKMIVEQTFPIVTGNSFKGIAGVDRSPDYIDRLLNNLKQQNGQAVMLEQDPTDSSAYYFSVATIDEGGWLGQSHCRRRGQHRRGHWQSKTTTR